MTALPLSRHPGAAFAEQARKYLLSHCPDEASKSKLSKVCLCVCVKLVCGG